MGAFFLHGSIALNTFDPQHGDIDFVAVLNRRCTTQDTNILADIHACLAQKYPQWQMDGDYLQWGDLGKAADAIDPHPRVNDGFQIAGQFSGGWVTWWLLKNHGIVVIGIDPQILDINVDWDVLIADMNVNLNTYWIRFLRDPRRLIWLFTDDGIEWIVLGVLRQFYTFHEQDITSKIGAGEYALQHLPQRWHRIIQEALRIRQQKTPSLYQWRIHGSFVVYYCNVKNHYLW